MTRLLIVITILLSSLIPGHAVASADTDTYERRVVQRINVARANHNLPPVRHGACADAWAERWARHLTTLDSLRHSNIDRLRRTCRKDWAGEVLARGSFTPRQVVRAWMKSPAHRRVLLKPLARRIGVGVVQGCGGKNIVVDFLSRR